MDPPWHFRVAKALIRRGIRGPGLWLRLAHRLGLLDRVVTYSLGAGVEVDVPLGRWENLWDAEEVRGYEAAYLDELAKRLLPTTSPATLIDCGADIGLFPLLLALRGVKFERIVAFEPNTRALGALRTNIARLGSGHEVRDQAVADFVGRGKLVRPDYDPSEHAWHLAPDDPVAGQQELLKAAPIGVTTIDAVLPAGHRPKRLVLKIDVEGGELGVVVGARETLRAAEALTVLIEAHPLVFRHTGIDPLAIVREIASLRPVQVHLAERPDLSLDLARPFFNQLPDAGVGNLIVEGC
jgi:FkbM family methyltransferase